jgi:hypothetical protein
MEAMCYPPSTSSLSTILKLARYLGISRMMGARALLCVNSALSLGEYVLAMDPAISVETKTVVVAKITQLITVMVKARENYDAAFVVGALDEIGKFVFPAMIAAFVDKNQPKRPYITSELGEIGPDAYGAVRALLTESQQPFVAELPKEVRSFCPMGPGGS